MGLVHVALFYNCPNLGRVTWKGWSSLGLFSNSSTADHNALLKCLEVDDCQSLLGFDSRRTVHFSALAWLGKVERQEFNLDYTIVEIAFQ